MTVVGIEFPDTLARAFGDCECFFLIVRRISSSPSHAKNELLYDLPLTAGITTTFSQQLVRKPSHPSNIFPSDIPPLFTPLLSNPPREQAHLRTLRPGIRGRRGRKNGPRSRCFFLNGLGWRMRAASSRSPPNLFPLAEVQSASSVQSISGPILPADGCAGRQSKVGRRLPLQSFARSTPKTKRRSNFNTISLLMASWRRIDYTECGPPTLFLSFRSP